MRFRFLCIFALILIAGSAFADLAPTGTPIPTGSWTQQFLESGVGPFNNILFIITTPGITMGDAGNPTGLNAFAPNDNSSWGSSLMNPQTSWGFDNWYGVGYPTELYFNATFSSNPDQAFNALFYAYNDNNLVEFSNVSWDGSNWNVSPAQSTPAVPEPASLVMLSSGLMGMGGILRRKLSK